MSSQPRVQLALVAAAAAACWATVLAVVDTGNMTHWTPSKNSYTHTGYSGMTTWTAEKDTAVRRLTKDLLWLYDPNVRPVIDFSSAIEVTHFFLLQQVIYLDSKEQKLKAFFFEVWIWTDEYLTWDPAHFEGIQRITLMRENLWIPDVVVFNQVGENSNYYMRENIIPVTLHHTGSIRLDTPQKYETTCLIEIENFPFDTQTCIIVVGSWSQSADTIIMKNMADQMDSVTYIENSEWQMLMTSSTSDIFQYEGSEASYSEIHYTVKLKRRLAFYNRNLIIPMILISFMAQLVFLLPPESGEKISLAITVFLALSLNMLVISEYIPANSLQTPIASKYCLFSMFLVCLSLWLSVLVLNLQGSESASYLYSSKPNERVSRLARAIGPWLLVGGSPRPAAASSRKRGPIPLKPIKLADFERSHQLQQQTSPVCIPNHVTFEKIENHVMSNSNHVNQSAAAAAAAATSNHAAAAANIYRNPHTCANNSINNNRMATSRLTGGSSSIQRHTIYYSMNESLDQPQPPQQQSPALEQVLEVFLEKLEAIQAAQHDKKDLSEQTKEMLEEWGYLARVVDRFFAAVYFIVNVMCLLPFIPYYAGWV